MLGPLIFTSPVLLLGLLVLPVLWLLLRAIPPAPKLRRFAGVALLLGLKDADHTADKTPWWLLVLRALALAAAILGFAGPVLNPRVDQAGSGPLLIVFDGGWADARDWGARLDRARALLDEASRLGRPAALIRLTDLPAAPVFRAAGALAEELAGVTPRPMAPQQMQAWTDALPEGSFDSFWLADGLDHPDRGALFAALASHGDVHVFQSQSPVFALHPARFDDGAIQLFVERQNSSADLMLEVIARGPDPSGVERELARTTLTFAPDVMQAEAALILPTELRNRVQRFEILGQRNAGAVSLTDDSLKRRKIALIGGGADREALQLLSPTHYLREALVPVADLIDGSLSDVLAAKPDVIVLADVARLTQTETDGMLDWLDQGGLLLRFAGPRMAASDVGRGELDPLMPVQLRSGGRTAGGPMSWGEPKELAPFPDTSPFFGLRVPADVTVTTQVLAQPAPDLSARTIAALADGTPLVTRSQVGQGEVVLVHVTANAEWSSLPLSGLFVQMLERLAVSTRPSQPDAAELAGQTWVPDLMLDAFGQPVDAGDIAGVAGEDLADALSDGPSLALPPGLYAGADRRVALNVIGADTSILPANWPAGAVIEGLQTVREQALKGALLAASLVLLSLDVVAALWLTGRISGNISNLLRGGATGAALVLALSMTPSESNAQTDDAFALEATYGVVLAYVRTGDARIDAVSDAGLRGLGERLRERTSIEPEAPMGIDIETDELAFFPFLYWPVSADQPLPSARAYDRLNAFLLTGGVILFDTSDSDLAATGATTPEARALQILAAGLDFPPLEQLPKDHVLTRSFYLLQDFPGRSPRGAVWVEASDPDAEKVEGMPFRNLNDGVTPVVIGGNDWAAAWAINADGSAMFPVGRGFAGERQREMAARFGINLIMYVLTGNYKSDQVHVPALLERLGE